MSNRLLTVPQPLFQLISHSRGWGNAMKGKVWGWRADGEGPSKIGRSPIEFKSKSIQEKVAMSRSGPIHQSLPPTHTCPSLGQTPANSQRRMLQASLDCFVHDQGLDMGLPQSVSFDGQALYTLGNQSAANGFKTHPKGWWLRTPPLHPAPPC